MRRNNCSLIQKIYIYPIILLIIVWQVHIDQCSKYWSLYNVMIFIFLFANLLRLDTCIKVCDWLSFKLPLLLHWMSLFGKLKWLIILQCCNYNNSIWWKIGNSLKDHNINNWCLEIGTRNGTHLIDTITLLFISNSGYQLSPQLKIMMFDHWLNGN